MSLAPGLVDIGSFIDQREGYRGGRPFIVGTGVTVDRISVMYRVDGFTAEKIAEEMRLTLPQVHAALSFYLANKERIDREIEESDRALEEEARAYYAKYGRTRLSGDTSLPR